MVHQFVIHFQSIERLELVKDQVGVLHCHPTIGRVTGLLDSRYGLHDTEYDNHYHHHYLSTDLNSYIGRNIKRFGFGNAESQRLILDAIRLCDNFTLNCWEELMLHLAQDKLLGGIQGFLYRFPFSLVSLLTSRVWAAQPNCKSG